MAFSVRSKMDVLQNSNMSVVNGPEQDLKLLVLYFSDIIIGDMRQCIFNIKERRKNDGRE